jgi:diguanylate cyclase (GGDEF)-like protein/PAS domain S-box-containing protein
MPKPPLAPYVSRIGLTLLAAGLVVFLHLGKREIPWTTWLVILLSGLAVFVLGWLLARLRRRHDPPHPSLEIMRQKQFFEALVLYSPIAIVSLDFSHNALSCNPAFERLFGFSQAEVRGHPIDDLIAPPDKHAEASQITRQVLAGASISFATQRSRKDGSPVEVEIYGVPVILGSQVVGVLGLYHDITERVRTAAYFKHLATHDSLTDLPNRAHFFEYLAGVQTEASRSGAAYGLLYLDLDGFKAVNDTYGHDVGDRALQAVAQRLQAVLGPHEFVARLGGDEFAFVLDHLADAADAAQVATRLLATFQAPFSLDAAPQPLTITLNASIGICASAAVTRPPHLAAADLPALLLKCADAAMYAAKDLGRGRFHFYTEALGRAATGEGTEGPEGAEEAADAVV